MDVRIGPLRKLSIKELMLWIVVLEKTLESPLDCKEMQPVSPKANQSWIFIGRTDAEAPVLWPPDAKSQLVGKDPSAGKDWSKQRRGQQRMRWFESFTSSMDVNLSKLWKTVKDREAWHAAAHGVAKSRTWLSNWTTICENTLLFFHLWWIHFFSFGQCNLFHLYSDI